tara:strand:- start:419 stop:742 length:324 start_codon:yes stop_codon:yes gene_type:complete
MPSARKRIGYLPSPNTKEIITKIANSEKLSQSKVVGILVEEALISRGIYHSHNTHKISIKNMEDFQNNNQDISLKYNDLDELISDKGITYNQKKYTYTSDDILSNSR